MPCPKAARPIAQAYAGHQFGHFTALGDGRAILLGEQITPSGDRFDIQLKGAGQTRFSRRGDGRAALGPMLREYIISEAMHALGIPTTRSLAVVTTGEPVYRETVARRAPCSRAWPRATSASAPCNGRRRTTTSLRCGRLRTTRWRGTTRSCAGSPEPYLALFDAIVARQASLIARWQLVGFIHGVMNTDNMALSGETIDYGPCAFMDTYDPATVFSSIDQAGGTRTATSRRSRSGTWRDWPKRCCRCSIEDLDRAVERATAALDRFPGLFEQHWLDGMRAKLGLFTQEDDDEALVDDLLAWMQRRSADFTNTFRALTSERRRSRIADSRSSMGGVASPAGGAPRAAAAVGRRGAALMRRHNPAFIPRNHKVEEALLAATGSDDFSVMERLLEVLAAPYDHDGICRCSANPAPSDRFYRTYCGT